MSFTDEIIQLTQIGYLVVTVYPNDEEVLNLNENVVVLRLGEYQFEH